MTRAARFHGTGDVRLDTVAIGDPRPLDIVVAPLAVGICGTDLHILEGEFPSAVPVTLGHEICGRVAAVGVDVSNVAVGDLVTIEPHIYCTVCVYCRTGREHLCVAKRAFGVHLDGGLAELLRVPARTAYPLPDDTDPRVGCLTEPLACCIHGIDRLGLDAGGTVLVIGAGPAGLILAQLARMRGASVVHVADLHAERLVLSASMGADRTFNAVDPEWEQAAIEATGGLGYEYVVEATGRADCLELGVRVAAKGGTVLVFGVAAPTARAEIAPYEVFSKELSVVGSVINPYTHEAAVRLLPSMNLDVFKFGEYRLEEIDAAFDAHRNGAVTKVIVAPNGPSS